MDFFTTRRAGVLLHPTALPNSLGHGDLGEHAYRFVDWLATTGCSVWQMLPIQQPHGDLSPYQCESIYAGNRSLISLTDLIQRGWLPEQTLPNITAPQAVASYRLAALQQAKQCFLGHASKEEWQAYQTFNEDHAAWLDEYALYAALKAEQHGQAWWQWDAALRDRQPAALQAAEQRLSNQINQVRFEQFVFFEQWQALKHYAQQQGILLLGDVPIFVAEDSAEVWARRDLFLLDDAGRPTVVAGVPPDYFAATGQRWGNPLYNWEVMQAEDFAWWRQRLQVQQLLFDAVRIDHFRGFAACWQIPADCETAVEGCWVESPGIELFTALQQHLSLPMLAEDLGVITEDVVALREQFNLPGMKILHFAFDSGANNPYLPHNYQHNCVVYTGTHDNDTTLGWFQQLSSTQQQHVCHYLATTAEQMPWALINAALASVARLAVIPMQDVLALDSTARMNIPGTTSGNWRWQFSWEQLSDVSTQRLARSVTLYGR